MKLTTGARKALPTKAFALPGKRAYPIEDKSHARNALARVSQHGTPAQKAEVRSKVHAKFPQIGEKSMKSHQPPHTKGLHERGSHESHKREHERADMSHKEFEAIDHGGKHDHMKGREKGPC